MSKCHATRYSIPCEKPRSRGSLVSKFFNKSGSTEVTIVLNEKNSKKFVTSKAFINIDDEENKGKLDKLTKKDFEAKLAIDLLQKQ